MSRKRYAYTLGGVPLPEPIEVSEDYRGGDERMPLYTDRFMEGHHTVDGVDIGSRAKRRDYMRANGLADYSDFTEHWKKKAEERRNPRFSGDIGGDIARAYDKLATRRK